MQTNSEKYLIQFTGGTKQNQTEAFDFTKNELTFGRDEKNDIQFDAQADLTVSREHGRIIKKAEDCFLIADNDSRNGTYVNGRKVNGTILLNPGDEVQLGVNGPRFIFNLQSLAGKIMPTQVVSVGKPTNIIDVKAKSIKTKKSPKITYWMAAASLILVAGIALSFVGINRKSTLAKMAGEGELDVQILPMAAVMPAAYKVYSNPSALDGRYYFAKLVLDNKGKGALKDVKVEYSIPGYINWTTASEIKNILPDGSSVVTIYPQFSQKITEKTTESTERAQIRITYSSNGKQEKYEKIYPFQMLSRNDFLYTNIPAAEISGPKDREDNNDLAPVFITPQDPIVKYYTQQVQEKVLGGATASVGNDPVEAIRFMMGLYEATRRSNMVYSGTGGAFIQTSDISSIQQKVRLPREVITGNTGLCIEMSFLYASVFAAEGLEPVIFFVPGHAYPGIRFKGQIFAIEPTAVGGEGIGGVASATQAFEAGMKQYEEFNKMVQAGDPRYTMIDVNELIKNGVHQMELSDDAFLRTKVDEMASRFAIGGPIVFANQKQTVQNGQQVQ